MPRSTSPQGRDAARVLGSQITIARRRRRWTAEQLASRAGISPVTLRKVERGDPGVAFGTVLDVAVLVGVPLFGATSSEELRGLAEHLEDRVALLPRRVLPITDEDLDDAF